MSCAVLATAYASAIAAGKPFCVGRVDVPKPELLRFLFFVHTLDKWTKVPVRKTVWS